MKQKRLAAFSFGKPLQMSEKDMVNVGFVGQITACFVVLPSIYQQTHQS